MEICYCSYVFAFILVAILLLMIIIDAVMGLNGRLAILSFIFAWIYVLTLPFSCEELE